MTEPANSSVPSAADSGAAAGAVAARLKATMEALFDFLFVVDRDGRIYDYHAPRPERLFVPPEQFIGQKISDVLPQAAAAIIHAEMAKALAQGYSRGGIYSLPYSTGERFFELSVAPQNESEADAARLILIARDITARQQVEAALQESEARYAQLARASRTAVWEMDPAGRCTHVGPQVEEVLGYRPEEMVGRLYFYDLFAPGRREEFKAAAFKVFQQHGLLQDFENLCVTKAGRPVWVSTTAFPLFNADGTLRGYGGSVTDITARKQAEAELKKSQDKYRMLFTSIRDAFVSVDMQGHILECNPAYEALTGYSAEELRSLTYMDLTPAEWHAIEAKIVAEQVLPRGFSAVYEKEYRRKNGTQVPIELRTILIRDDAGRPAGMWATVRDISARKQAEAGLRWSEMKYRQLFETIRDAFARSDLQGRIVETNAAFQALTGYSAEELAGTTRQDLVAPEDHARIVQGVAEQLLPRGYTDLFPARLLRKDGTSVPVEMQSHLIRDDAGRPAGVWATVRDITERQRADYFLRLVLDTIPVAVFWKDRDSVFLGCNQAIARAAGLDSPQQIVGKTDHDLGWKKEESDYYVAMDRWVMENDQAETHIIEPQLQADGREVWLDTCKIPLHDEEGRVIGILGAFQDITEHRNLEQALRDLAGELEHRVHERTAELEASRQALMLSEEKFRQMAESIQEAFWLFDVRTRTPLFMSPAYRKIWGRPTEPLPPSFSSWLASIHSEDRARAAASFERGLGSGDEMSYEYRILRPDGSIRWIEDSNWAIRDASGDLVRVAGVMRDITEHRRLEAEILRAGETERQRIGRDLHDGLSQSLTAIGYWNEAVRASLARQSRPEAADLQKLAELIAKTGKQAHTMAQGLLLTDLKRGGLIPGLQGLALDVRELFGVACRYQGPAKVTLPNADTASQLYRIAQEAAINAAKHSQGKKIVIRLQKQRAGLRLSIRDDGHGLRQAPKQQAGLGLDIMRYRAGMIDAEFSIDSAPGQGTTVTCLIPQRTAPTRKKKT